MGNEIPPSKVVVSHPTMENDGATARGRGGEPNPNR
eukprot:CAMPEP_0194353840 /NCGR_PEP_ID=MMETSP0174-20130528/2066_1 /TAXON_ID=216777 /ORGANISM="Proboscia alata, Strain PI-D3" /LENGTH=35 /DNA_ID= /DNA_START= /DNA_END= /DNA_ORIENTATION=